jgi:hypothetical protein
MQQVVRGSSRRRWAWISAAVAIACGSSSDLEGIAPGPNEVGGAIQSGGRGAVGGSAPLATGGAMTACVPGNACWTPNSYCTNGDVRCECVNGVWGSCSLMATGGAGPIWTGGAGPTGGRYSASGGAAPIPVCETVSVLPAMGTECSTAGQSQCLPTGDRCICERGIWYCNTSCDATPPAPDSACARGAACSYGSGESCACVNLRWMCIGESGCPSDVPGTGEDCSGLTGTACDYPGAVHLACVCIGGADPSVSSTWTCLVSGDCPATQPTYNPGDACSAVAICTYGNTHCACLPGAPWICV